MRTYCRSLLVALAIASFTVSTAAGQTLSGAVVAGLTGSTFSDFADVGPAAARRQIGLLAGFSLEIRLERFVSLQPEVLYSQKGTRLETTPLPGSASSAVVIERFDYIETPILIRVGATAGRDGPYAVAGPAFAALARAREHIEVPGFPTQDLNIKDGVTGTDVGVVIGGGVSIGRLDIEGRFDAGLRSLIPPDDRRSGDPHPANRSLTALARLRF
jgi:hypothetical protein